MELIYTLNVTGLLFDIIGAFMLASELVHQFKGKRFRDIGQAQCSDITYSPETEEYQQYRVKKEKIMKIGLVFIFFGIVLQISSNLLSYIQQGTS